jgi:peroxiredoxin
LKGQPIEVITIDVYEEPEAARRFIKLFGYNYPVALDADNAVADQYGVEQIPAVFLIDKRGVVRYQSYLLPDLARIRQVMK